MDCGLEVLRCVEMLYQDQMIPTAKEVFPPALVVAEVALSLTNVVDAIPTIIRSGFPCVRFRESTWHSCDRLASSDFQPTPRGRMGLCRGESGERLTVSTGTFTAERQLLSCDQPMP